MTGWKEIIVWEFYDAKQNLHGSKYVGELIRCKDCRYYDHGENECESWSLCIVHINRYFQTCADNFCSWAERKEECGHQ